VKVRRAQKRNQPISDEDSPHAVLLPLGIRQSPARKIKHILKNIEVVRDTNDPSITKGLLEQLISAR